MAVWRQETEQSCIAASRVISEALTLLGIRNEIVPVAVIVEGHGDFTRRVAGNKAFDFVKASMIEHGDMALAEALTNTRPVGMPEFWVDGGHAIVVCSEARLLLDATFDQFGTEIQFLISDFEPEKLSGEAYWRYGTDAVDVFYFPVADVIELDEATGIALRVMASELVAVGRHVGFDHDVITQVEHTLFPTMDNLDRIVADMGRGGTRLLETFRSSRDARLAKLGYPGRVPDAWAMADGA